GSSSDKEL
ncbi:Protein of unknown function, partial [Gryllus bimaculatus]